MSDLDNRLYDMISYGMVVILQREIKQDFHNLRYMSRTQPAEEEEEDGDELKGDKKPEAIVADKPEVIVTEENEDKKSSPAVAVVGSDECVIQPSPPSPPLPAVGGQRNGSSRRRRVSSSSSECSDGGYRKSVSFSHPISVSKKIDEVDEVAAKKAGGEKDAGKRQQQQIFPTRSCLRVSDDDVTSNHSNGDVTTATAAATTARTEEAEEETDTHRWAARFEDMRSINEGKLKHVTWSDDDDASDNDDNDDAPERFVKFSLEQHHLLVGHGGMFSSVYLGLTDQNRQVAVKKSSNRKADLLTEAGQSEKLLKLEKHDSLIQYYDIVREKPNYYLISELGEYSLDQIFTSHSIFHLPSSVSSCLSQLTSGLSHLHRNDILHRSLRPSNVLVGRDGFMKLSDYGLHSSAAFHMTNIPIPVKCWVSTEILKSKTLRVDLFTKVSDISSLGMVFYYICTSGGYPFGDLSASSETCLANLQRGSYNLKSLVSSPFQHHLIKNMIFKEPEKRFTLEQVAKHPFFVEKSEHVNRLQQMMDIYGKYKSYVTDLLQAHSREILSLYAERSNLSSMKEEVSTVAHLFKAMKHSLEDPQFFDEISEGHREQDESVLEFFIKTFPGLVLSAFDLLRSLPDTNGRTKTKNPISPTIEAKRKSLHNGEGDFQKATSNKSTSILPTARQQQSARKENGFISPSNNQCELSSSDEASCRDSSSSHPRAADDGVSSSHHAVGGSHLLVQVENNSSISSVSEDEAKCLSQKSSLPYTDIDELD